MSASSVTDLIVRHGRAAPIVVIGALIAAAIAYGVPAPGGGEGPARADDEAGAASGAAHAPEPEPREATRPSDPRALPPGVHPRAWLLAPALLRESPGGRPVARLGMRTRFGFPTVLAVVRVRGPWLGVLSERLANGRVGWVHERRVRLGSVAFELRASLRRRELTLLHRGQAVRRMRVGIGGSATPTPRGRFAVTDRLTTRGVARDAYGCCVIALSGRQPSLPPSWLGGDRLAIHSTNATSSIGSSASLGCLRASERDMRWLMRRVPLGTQIRIG